MLRPRPARTCAAPPKTCAAATACSPPAACSTPAALGLAAALGEASLPIRRKPTVAVFTTGDELRPPGSQLGPGQIYDSNRVLLQALLLAEGLEPVAWPVLPDEPGRVAAALRDAAESFDVVLYLRRRVRGREGFPAGAVRGTGRGAFLESAHAPGHARAGGAAGQGACSWRCLAIPSRCSPPSSPWGGACSTACRGAAQPRPRRYARLAAAIHKRHDRLEFLRGELSCDETGQWLALPNPADGSHRLRAAAEANALIVVPEGAGEWPAGSVLEVLPLAAG